MVKFVFGQFCHGKGTRNGDLDWPVGMRAQIGNVMHLHRMFAFDLTSNARHRDHDIAPIWHQCWIVQINARQRIGEPVEIALAADFPVRQNVDAGALLIMYRSQGRVILRLV